MALGHILVEDLYFMPDPAQQDGEPQNKQHITDDRADKGGFDDRDLAVLERYNGDNQFGRIPEGSVEETADRRTAVFGQLFGRGPHIARQRNDRQRGDGEDPTG